MTKRELMKVLSAPQRRVMELRTKRRVELDLLPILSVFGVGVVAGSAVALLLAPRTGAQLRSGIRDRAVRLGRRVKPASNYPIHYDQMTSTHLQSRARDLGIQHPETMSRRELIERIEAR